MRNNYFPKDVLLTASIVIGTLAGVNAQAPLLKTNVGLPSKSTVSTSHDNNHERCVSDKLMHDYIERNGLQEVFEMERLIKQNTSTQEPAERAVRTVPIVFHVIYDNQAATNVSDAVIAELLERLNEDYRKNNSLIGNIRPAFAGVAADAQIEFCLATKTPGGLTTTGIDRVQTSLTYFDPSEDNVVGSVGGANSMKTAQYGAAPWDRSKYINIWICDITNGQNYGTAGYAYLGAVNANALPPPSIDGIVLDYNIGVQGGTSRAISHEVGHYFGLEHTFGEDNITSCSANASEDDGFADTPVIRGPFQNYYNSCSGSALTAQSCTAGTLWQYENIMDYGYCESMFTTQQSNYMNSVLSGARASLLTSTATNCSAPVPAFPVASFTGCNANVAQGSTVTFTDATTGIPTSWSWSITPGTGWIYVGGTSATSQNPQVQFTTTGNYTVALTATNALGNNTKTSANCITVVVATCNNLTSPLVMGFETNESLTGWGVENTNGDQANGDDVTWGITDNATLSANTIPVTAHGGTQTAFYLYSSSQAANDWLFTPCLSLQSGTTHSLKFWYRATEAAYPEKMRVSIGTSAASASMMQNIVNLSSITNTSWVQSTTNFTVPTTGNYYVGFQAYSAADQYILFLDDINISKVSSGVTAPVANFSGCGNYTTGNTVTFTNTSTNTPTSNSWSITPGTGWSYVGSTSASSASPQVMFTTPGTYTVALTATNAGGNNTKTSQSCVIVANNNAGLEDLNFSSGISLYPNPSNGLTTLDINNASNYTNLRVNVYNAVGQLVYNTPIMVDQISLDLSAYSKGIYFIEVRSNEAVATKRLVLSK